MGNIIDSLNIPDLPDDIETLEEAAKGKPEYLLLAEWMGRSESLEQLINRCHTIIETYKNIK